MTGRVEFWFDFSCPYAYVASTRIEALARRAGAELDPRPMLLGGVFRARGTPQNLSATLNPAKATHNLNDMRRQAQQAGVPLHMPPGHPLRTVEALRCVLAVGEPFMPLAHRFYRAYWAEGRDIGQGAVVVDGGDKGTVFVVETNGATLRHLTITGSGDSHDSDDGCLNLRGHRNTIEDVTIADCLFGIDLKQSHDNLLRGNRVRSKVADLGVRGDGIRLWYSHRNRIEGNLVTDSRDMVAWYSHDNLYLRNEGRRSRYSIHFMYANRNVVEHNRFIDNAVGVYFMYCEGGGARHNLISHDTGATGMALGFKEASDIYIETPRICKARSGFANSRGRPWPPRSYMPEPSCANCAGGWA